jgi:hypothetical protein
MALTKAWDSNNTIVRAEIWSKMIQDELQEELMGDGIVDWMTDFPDGDQINIPTLGSMSTRDYEENTPITIDDPTVGEFNMVIDKYVQSGIGIVDKLKHDTFYMEILVSKFPEQVLRAVKERMESDIMDLHKKQTSNDANNINGRAHRFTATGTSNAFTVQDFAKAKLALDKAFVSKVGRIAIVDPVAAYQLVQIDNVIRQDVYGPNSNLKDGFGSTNFIGKYLGFDVFESNMLDSDTALDHVTGGSLIANLFLGDEAFVGAMRLAPEIEQSRDWNKKRDIYHVTSRYGLDLIRPEGLVCVLSGA